MGKRAVNQRGITLKKLVLRKARKVAGLSQRGLADKIDCHILTAWRAENGIAVDPGVAKAIADAVKVPLAVLMR